MNLQQINQRLEELAKELDNALKALHEVEYLYNKRYFQLLMQSHMMSADKREAEVKAILEEEGLLKPFADRKIDVRTLLHEKDILIELSKNIRVLRGMG